KGKHQEVTPFRMCVSTDRRMNSSVDYFPEEPTIMDSWRASFEWMGTTIRPVNAMAVANIPSQANGTHDFVHTRVLWIPRNTVKGRESGGERYVSISSRGFELEV